MIIIILSFILDNVVASLINLDSLMYPLFTILSIILVYPYFGKVDNRLSIIAFILGIFYDITYTNTLFLNGFIFLLLSYITKIVFSKFSYNYISVFLVSIITIIYYRIFVYIILFLINYLHFDIFYLIKGIYSSLIINIIYITIIYIFAHSKRLIFRRKWHIYLIGEYIWTS